MEQRKARGPGLAEINAPAQWLIYPGCDCRRSGLCTPASSAGLTPSNKLPQTQSLVGPSPSLLRFDESPSLLDIYSGNLWGHMAMGSQNPTRPNFSLLTGHGFILVFHPKRTGTHLTVHSSGVPTCGLLVRLPRSGASFFSQKQALPGSHCQRRKRSFLAASYNTLVSLVFPS